MITTERNQDLIGMKTRWRQGREIHNDEDTWTTDNTYLLDLPDVLFIEVYGVNKYSPSQILGSSAVLQRNS